MARNTDNTHSSDPRGAAPPGLGERIAEAAQEVGGQKKLSELSGISESQLYRYIGGTGQPTTGRLVAIADVAGVSVAWLATGKGSKNATYMPAAENEVALPPPGTRSLADEVDPDGIMGTPISPGPIPREPEEFEAWAGEALIEITRRAMIALDAARRRLLSAQAEIRAKDRELAVLRAEINRLVNGGRPINPLAADQPAAAGPTPGKDPTKDLLNNPQGGGGGDPGVV